MNAQALKTVYKISTAPVQAIIGHLHQCADSFSPPLSTYVDIDTYGKKIYEKAITFEAWDGNRLVGLVAAYCNDKIKKIGYITNVSVLNEYQEAGIASRLMKNAIIYGKRKSFVKLMLEMQSGNIKAINLYKKLGFILVEQNNQYEKIL